MLPFLTTQFKGLDGIIKLHPGDFCVEELPLCPPCGQGAYLYALMEKKGLSTMEALARIAQALHIPRQRIGFAGLKDAQGITRQWISLENLAAENLRPLRICDVRLLQFDRHEAPLKRGHLAGNRFTIRLRDINLPLKAALGVAEQIIDELTRRGVPNYFGSQRFGHHHDSHQLGEAVARGQIEAFVDLFLGGHSGQDTPRIAAARRLYQTGDFKKAHDTWPYAYADQRRALKALIQKDSPKQAYHAVDKRLKGLFVSAYQSHLFNQVLTRRMPHPDRLLAGDLAYDHANGSFLPITDAAREQLRCEAFAISPTGPLLGNQTPRLTGPAGEQENLILDATGLSDRDFQQMSDYGAHGTRRPLRFQPHHAQVTSSEDRLGPCLQFRFDINTGCYATSFLREITKTNL